MFPGCIFIVCAGIFRIKTAYRLQKELDQSYCIFYTFNIYGMILVFFEKYLT